MSRANATARAALATMQAADMALAAGSPEALHLANAAEMLERKAKFERQRESQFIVPALPADATEAEVQAARRLAAVRYGDKTYMPLWVEALFAVPNLLTRGRLFAATELSDDYIKGDVVAEVGGAQLQYWGLNLNQYALHVYAVAIDLAKNFPMSNETSRTTTCSVTFRQFCRAMGLNYSPSTHRRIRDCLLRLNNGNLRITKDSFNLSLPRLLSVNFYEPEFANQAVLNYGQREQSALKGRDLIEISIPDDLAVLFLANAYTRLAKRALADRTELAAWLAWYYSGHRSAKWISIDYLHKTCGSKATPRSFRVMLARELKELTRDIEGAPRVVEFRMTSRSGDTPARICVLMSNHDNPDILRFEPTPRGTA